MVGQEIGSGRRVGRQVLQEGIRVDQTELPEVLRAGRKLDHFYNNLSTGHVLHAHHGQTLHLFTNSLVEEVLREKLVDGGSCQVEGQHFEHQVLHSQHLLLGVGVICDVDELCHFRGVDFLKLPACASKTKYTAGTHTKQVNH